MHDATLCIPRHSPGALGSQPTADKAVRAAVDRRHRLRNRIVPLCIIALGPVLLYLFRSRLVIGDGATYAATIHSGDLVERSIHIGYYALGWVVHHLLAPLGLPLDASLILLNVLAAPAAVAVSWILFRALGVPRVTASLAAVVLLFTGCMLWQGTTAEIYAVQLVLVLASYVAFLRGFAVLSGVLFGVAMTVSMTTLFASAFFVWHMGAHGVRREHWVTVAVAVLLFGAVLAAVWDEYFFGTRGLLIAGAERPYGWATIAYNVYALVKNCHVLVPFAAVGLWSMVRTNVRLAWLLGAAVLGHAPAIAGMREDGVFLLTAFPFVALAAAFGIVTVWGWRHRISRAVVPAALALYACTSVWIWLEAPDHRSREVLMGLLEKSQPGDVVITDWDYGEALRFYDAALPAARIERLVDVDSRPEAEFRSALSAEGSVYIVDDYSPKRLSRLLLTSELDARKERFSLIARLRRVDPALAIDEVASAPRGPTVYRVRGR